MTPRRIVVVPYFYPPFSGSGNRWPALARYLRRSGHLVTVVATDAFGRLSDDDEAGIVRVGDLRSAPPLRFLLRRGEMPLAGQTAEEAPPTALLTKVLVPDSNVVSWLPAAVFAVRGLLARQRVDAVVTSSPTESNHLIGLMLGARRPAWIADFRDGWCFEPLREPFPTPLQRALDAWLERRVVQQADLCVGATLPIAEDLERRFGVSAAYVPNGSDPEEAVESTANPEMSKNGVSLVLTGRLSGVRGSDPGPLLRALRIVRDDLSCPLLRLVLAGPLRPDERELIERSGVADAVEHRGILSRQDALALQRSADALVVITSRNKSEATGKLFEYLTARRPIVALAEGNEAERIVRETNTGVTVPPDSVDAIAAALRRVATGELALDYEPRNLERFTYPGPANTMADLVESAIERRAQGVTKGAHSP